MKDKRSELLAKANAPIGFYVLALLVVETFIASVAIMGGFSANQKFACLIIGVVLFVLCVGIVTALSWYKPRNLTYSEASHLEESLHRPEFGSSIKPRSESEVDALPPREPPPELTSGDS